MNTAVEKSRAIGREVAIVHADDVDQKSRFPAETIQAVRAAGLLGASVPQSLGGLGASATDLVTMCQNLAQGCSASGMVFAMHHIKVASLVRHMGQEPKLRAYAERVVKEQRLVASVTSEVGVGGDMRSSVCAVERSESGFSVVKDATTISYGAHADDLLLTSRRASDSPAGDQVLVLLEKGNYELEPTTTWDTLGMRGTCSPGFKVRGKGPLGYILPTPFSEIATMSMVPYSHLLWSGVWLGIASEAVNRARTFVRGEARKRPGFTPPAAIRLAEVTTQLQTMREHIHAASAEYDELAARPDGGRDALSSMGWALRINQLKIASSEAAAAITHLALGICGILGYKNGSPFSIGRLHRDALSAALMINNDRIHTTNASILLVHKDDT